MPQMANLSWIFFYPMVIITFFWTLTLLSSASVLPNNSNKSLKTSPSMGFKW